MLFFFFLTCACIQPGAKKISLELQQRLVCLISLSPRRSSRPDARVFPNSFCSYFRFLLMPVDCQSTKALIYSGVAPILRAVCSRSILPFLSFFFLFCAHCVYTANYAWRLCTPSSCRLSHPSVFLADWLIVLRWIR